MAKMFFSLGFWISHTQGRAPGRLCARILSEFLSVSGKPGLGLEIAFH